jgi:hypothetical protein
LFVCFKDTEDGAVTVAQVEECHPSKHKAEFNPQYCPQEKKKFKEEEYEKPYFI